MTGDTPEFTARSIAFHQAPSAALARLLRGDTGVTYAKDLPSAVACPDDDFEACVAHLRFPVGHRWAILTRAAERWRGIKISGFEPRQLKAIRGELDDQFTTRNAPVTSAAPTRLFSNDGTSPSGP